MIASSHRAVRTALFLLLAGAATLGGVAVGWADEPAPLAAAEAFLSPIADGDAGGFVWRGPVPRCDLRISQNGRTIVVTDVPGGCDFDPSEAAQVAPLEGGVPRQGSLVVPLSQ